MESSQKILENFGLKFSKKDREMTKKFINIVFILLLVFLIGSFIILGYLTFHKYIKPSLQQSE